MRYRLFDIFFTIICISLIWPLCLLIALLIKLESKGPILYKQKRVGKNEYPYYIFKFRSMYVHDYKPEELGPIKHDHALVTRVGYFLRRFKLDEIPQFLNVLRGEMSLIGPRPFLFSKIESMSTLERRRFEVLPGMSSWAEVNGNLELDWREQVKLDLWYLDHKGIGLYLLVLWKTIVTVVRGSIRNQKALHQAETYVAQLKARQSIGGL